MPTYEYLCGDCGHQWEAFQSIKDAALKVCARCGKETAERQVTGGGGFILKGGGWYSDLYGSSKKAESKPNGASTASSNGSTGASEKSSDAATTPKTETKTETKTAGDAKSTGGSGGTSGGGSS